MIPQAPIQFEIVTKCTYNDMMWAALSYRHNESVLLYLYDINDQFYVAYGHDFLTSDCPQQVQEPMSLNLGCVLIKESRIYFI